MSLTYEVIEDTLSDYLDPVLSTRRTAEKPAKGLLTLNKEQQEFALHWTDVIRKSNSEMAYQFVSRVPQAMQLMGTQGTRHWLLDAMDIYDKEGLYPGSAALNALEEFAEIFRVTHLSVSLDEIRPVLESFICGLSGRLLKIETGNKTYTDTNTLFLPATVNRFNDREKNYQLFKVIAVHLWAQTWFGTFKRASLDTPHLNERLATFADKSRAIQLFNLLETVRLNACIHRELPGLGRQMLGLHTQPPLHDATWKAIFTMLEMEHATVEDTLHATGKLYALQGGWPEALMYQAGLDLDAAKQGVEERLEMEKNELQMAIGDLLQQALMDDQAEQGDMESSSIEINQTPESGTAPELTLDGEPITVPPNLESLLESIMQDLDELPEEWLVPASDGDYDGTDHSPAAEDAWKSVLGAENAYVYDEWDYRRQTFRKGWCVLREMPTHPIYDDFYQRTIERYHHLIGEIRRHFEALRGEDKILKAEPVGDNIDIDALIRAFADHHTGVEMSDRLYTRKQKIERDLAVVFMVDVSGSTKGWINEAERESLILLCEALEVLGDQYAIYGFSGMTRNRCEIYKIKTFDEKYDREVQARISGLRPQDYTRMGVTIRHLTRILNKVDARTRILITLSDGKPDDYDGYRGEYGIEDTRKALLEARHTGIHPFCITIDTEASDYLPHMYGPASFVVVDEVRKLPLKVADIYRKLTT